MKVGNDIDTSPLRWRRCKRVTLERDTLTWELSGESYDVLDEYHREPHRDLIAAVDDNALRVFVRKWGPLRSSTRMKTGTDHIVWYREFRDYLAAIVRLLDAIEEPSALRAALLGLIRLGDFPLNQLNTILAFRPRGKHSEDLEMWCESAPFCEIEQLSVYLLNEYSLGCGDPRFIVVRLGRGYAVRATLFIEALFQALLWMVWQDVFERKPFRFCLECQRLIRSNNRHARKFCDDRPCGRRKHDREGKRKVRAKQKEQGLRQSSRAQSGGRGGHEYIQTGTCLVVRVRFQWTTHPRDYEKRIPHSGRQSGASTPPRIRGIGKWCALDQTSVTHARSGERMDGNQPRPLEQIEHCHSGLQPEASSSHFGSMLLADITPQHIGKYQTKRKKEEGSNRTINMEISTLRMIMKSARLWSAISQGVRMLPERREVGKALAPDEETRLRAACRRSPQKSLYTAVVVFCNTGLRSAELRAATWRQVDFLKAEFKVGKSKTAAGEGRVVPLNQTALAALKEWRARWPAAKPEDCVFPSEKLVFKGAGVSQRGTMTGYDVNLRKPLGSWKRAWTSAKRQAGVECRIHDLRHHFISLLAQTQTPDATIQAISGHLSRQMLELYSHVRVAAKRRAVELLDPLGLQAIH